MIWNSKGRRLYQMQSRTNLMSGSWNNAGEPVYGGGEGVPVTNELEVGAQTQNFYRVKVED